MIHYERVMNMKTTLHIHPRLFFHSRSFAGSNVDNIVTYNHDEDDKRENERVQGMFVFYNDEPNHGGDAYIQEIAEGEVVVLLEVFDDHGDEFEIQEKYKDIC